MEAIFIQTERWSPIQNRHEINLEWVRFRIHGGICSALLHGLKWLILYTLHSWLLDDMINPRILSPGYLVLIRVVKHQKPVKPI
ncbi:unnamed protein product [Linum trigynum]|uniref:Uncharacterized protein n=1 Tax=Linum trigynum TaxID=586398 RepID=A0AAV2CIG5_9ROSI